MKFWRRVQLRVQLRVPAIRQRRGVTCLQGLVVIQTIWDEKLPM